MNYHHETDLNYALTAVCFIADERVLDKEKYPDYYKNFFYESKYCAGCGHLLYILCIYRKMLIF